MSCGGRLAWTGSGCMIRGMDARRFAQGVPARAIMEVLGHAEIGVTMNTYMSCRCFVRRRPTRLTSCSEREVSGFGYSKGRFMIASGLWPGALGGTRTPNLLIRSQMLYPLSYERWCPASLRHSAGGMVR